MERLATTALDKEFNIVKIMIGCMPIAAYVYIVMNSGGALSSLEEILGARPEFSLVFVIAMINIIMAYLVNIAQSKFKEEEYEHVLVNLSLLFVAQILMFNVFFAAMIAMLIYKFSKKININIKEEIIACSPRNWLITGGGAFITLILSALCLFMNLQLNFL